MYQDLGPDSLLWRWAGDNRIAFLGGTIGLLQLMHPAIGAGVLEHSNFFDDPYGRVFRSLPRILGTVYDGERAEATGREVRDFHRDIKGTGYHALNPETFWWAHATFQFMTEQVADRFDNHRLTPAEREQLYQEGVEWYRRYGVSDRAVPPDRASFQVAWNRVCDDVLEINPAVEWVLDYLHEPKDVALPGPARRLVIVPVRLVAIGGLPGRLRRRLGIPWSAQDQIELDAIELVVRQSWRFVPFPMRWQPRARAAWKRVSVRGAA